MSRKINLLAVVLFSVVFICVNCKQKETSPIKESEPTSNTITDKKASALVNSMMTAMGGQEKWDELHYVSWTFFGARHLVWDKIGGRVRIDSPKDTSIYLVDLHNKTGKVIKGGKEVSDPQKLKELVKRGESIWINDSYWLFMPFKVKDPGVHVNYMREDTMVGGAPSSVLALTFNEVGNTPENKYEVFIDKNDNLIKQWAFFSKADQDTPPRIWPWDNYQSFNGLQLSSDRTDKSGPSNVRVYDSLGDEVFTSFDVFDYF